MANWLYNAICLADALAVVDAVPSRSRSSIFYVGDVLGRRGNYVADAVISQTHSRKYSQQYTITHNSQI